MNKEQITFLMNAGYSLDEIMQMQKPEQPAPQPEQPEQPEQPSPQPEQPEQPSPQPDPKPAQNDQSEQIQQLTAAVANLTQLVQKNNITGMQFGPPQPDRTVDDILAEIINPPGKHLKGGNS